MANLLKKLFDHNDLLDFSRLGADMHAHLIPEIDDGSTSVQESINMITGLQEMGYRKFISTSHIMPEIFNNTAEIIREKCDSLNNAIRSVTGVEVHPSAEYYVDENFPDRIRGGENFLSFGQNYILIEVNMMAKEKRLEETIFELQLKGYKVVLAHVERYPYMFENNSLQYYSGLCDADVYLQVNIRSFAGQYGEIQKKIARQLSEHNMISFLGTDLHRESQLPIIRSAMRDAHIQKLLSSDKLLNNQL